MDLNDGIDENEVEEEIQEEFPGDDDGINVNPEDDDEDGNIEIGTDADISSIIDDDIETELETLDDLDINQDLDAFDEDFDTSDNKLRNNDINHYNEIKHEFAKFDYKTIGFLSKYEKTRIIGTRATQIQNGAKPLVSIYDPKTGEKIRSPLDIAEKELREGVLPIKVERPLPSTVPHKYIYESRPLNTLII